MLHLIQPKDERYHHEDLRDHYDEVSNIALHFLKGSEATIEDWTQQRMNLRIASCIDELLHMMGQVTNMASDRDDIAELCGGAARVSIICTRRKSCTGKNFDPLTGYDLNKVQDQMGVRRYLTLRAPIVVLMAPTCNPFGSFGRLDQVINRAGWQASYH